MGHNDNEVHFQCTCMGAWVILNWSSVRYVLWIWTCCWMLTSNHVQLSLLVHSCSVVCCYFVVHENIPFGRGTNKIFMKIPPQQYLWLWVPSNFGYNWTGNMKHGDITVWLENMVISSSCHIQNILIIFWSCSCNMQMFKLRLIALSSNLIVLDAVIIGFW